MIEDHKILHFKVIPAKTNDSISQKSWKTLILGRFGPEMPENRKTGFFPKNRALSVFIIYESLTSYQKSEKTYDGKYENFWTNYYYYYYFVRL